MRIMLTTLGKHLRMMRIQRGELLKDMALKLTIAPTYLSSIETGKRTPSLKFISNIIDIYNLDSQESDELYSAYFDTQNEVNFSINNMQSSQRSLGIAFARKLKDLDSEQISEIQKILEERKK